MPRQRLGQALVEKGLLTPEQLEQALEWQRLHGDRLGALLVRRGLVSDEDVARVLAEQHGLPLIGPEHLANLPEALVERVRPEVAERFEVVPCGVDPETRHLLLATADPANLVDHDAVRFALDAEVSFVACPRGVLRKALADYYGVLEQKSYIALVADRDSPEAPPAPEGPPSSQQMLGGLAASGTIEILLRSVLDSLHGFSPHAAFFARRDDALLRWAVVGSPTPPGSGSVPLQESALARAALQAHQPLMRPPGENDPLCRCLNDSFSDASGARYFLPLRLREAAVGLFVLGDARPGVVLDLNRLGEFVRRAAWRLEALQLERRIAEPLPGDQAEEAPLAATAAGAPARA